ncbi:MAG: FtsQ-type POTRA domain-containing protein [Candidatus Eisenbacteria bacterium]|nr:FtsQ-type POTRA domain-containing protein [Candidatus Eisenbacteria bacterium]
MALYQGRALRADAPRGRRASGRASRVLRMLALAAAVAALAQVPWSALGRRWFAVEEIRVDGLHYLDEARVIRIAGLHRGDNLFAVDLERSRQALRLEPRIADARIERRWPRSLAVHVQERTPMMLVQHGVPWEIDSVGVLLPPLADGVEADVPLVVGPRFDRWPGGARVRTAEVERALAWVRALSDRDLELGGQLSEVDVTDPQTTALTLMSGTRVLSPAWPPARRTLSALRVVLADLHQRGTRAQELDMRFDAQIIVRPAPGAPPGAPGARSS